MVQVWRWRSSLRIVRCTFDFAFRLRYLHFRGYPPGSEWLMSVIWPTRFYVQSWSGFTTKVFFLHSTFDYQTLFSIPLTQSKPFSGSGRPSSEGARKRIATMVPAGLLIYYRFSEPQRCTKRTIVWTNKHQWISCRRESADLLKWYRNSAKASYADLPKTWGKFFIYNGSTPTLIPIFSGDIMGKQNYS